MQRSSLPSPPLLLLFALKTWGGLARIIKANHDSQYSHHQTKRECWSCQSLLKLNLLLWKMTETWHWRKHDWKYSVSQTGTHKVSHFCPNMPMGVVKTGKKENLHVHQKWPCTCKFCEPNFQEFRLKWWRKELFCIVGTSWMGWGRVEWDWYLGMSYLSSLNH